MDCAGGDTFVSKGGINFSLVSILLLDSKLFVSKSYEKIDQLLMHHKGSNSAILMARIS